MITPTPYFWEIFKNTEGALSCTEAVAIMNIAAEVPNGEYLEMGTHKGKSAMAAIYGLQHRNKFFLLEPEFLNIDFLNETYKSVDVVCGMVKSGVIPLYTPEYSTTFLSDNNERKYSYVFSDAGSHQDGLPLREVKLLEDKIIQGGIIAFHDFRSQFIEVEGAYEYLKGTGKYEEININWDEIISYVNDNNLEEGNKSWHHNELRNPCFVGALRRR